MERHTHAHICKQTLMRMERDLKGRYHKLLRAHPAAILQHGGRQNSARHLCHLVAHAELKLLDKRVGLIIRAPHLRDTETVTNRGQWKGHAPAVQCHRPRWYPPACWSPPACLVPSGPWLWSWLTFGCPLAFWCSVGQPPRCTPRKTPLVNHFWT